jgi:hypothetical protein
MPELSRDEVVQRLTHQMASLPPEDLAEVYNVLFPSQPTKVDQAQENRSDLLDRITDQIGRGLQAEEVVALWKVTFPKDRKVSYDPETNTLHYNEESKSYVRVDENGIYRVGAGRVMLDSVVAAFHQGHSPETIRQQYPALSLEDVYGSIAYYLGHLKEVNAYLGRQDAVWQEWQARSEARPSPVVDRLHLLKG